MFDAIARTWELGKHELIALCISLIIVRQVDLMQILQMQARPSIVTVTPSKFVKSGASSSDIPLVVTALACTNFDFHY